jgi:hypothetical protein
MRRRGKGNYEIKFNVINDDIRSMGIRRRSAFQQVLTMLTTGAPLKAISGLSFQIRQQQQQQQL